ncbi:VOC family protein [Agarilytica rhodophyticola]|uniref:VOC family protein n=1 Tax=Agarilytica rhodophyticola TaxID=1737490 RepID=UPI000B342E40|nr:VOC family protein [Agarilytica rhodophyticola]
MPKFIHTMLRVLDEQKSVDFYTKALGFTLKEVRDFSNFKLIYLKDSSSDFELELTVNKGQQEPYNLGNGYGHIAFVTDQLEHLHKKISSLGYEPAAIKTFAPEGQFVARFFFIKDPDNYDVEIIEQSDRYK